MKKLHELTQLGQSIWYDNIRRALLDSGELQGLLDDGVMGVTSNPSIFEKAIAGSADYDEAIKALAYLLNNLGWLGPVSDRARRWLGQETGHSPEILRSYDSDQTADQIYESLALEDIRRTADLLHPIYAATNGVDGYVSLEVSPTLAHDTAGTIAAARRLYAALARPNVMIKVPATPAGIQAIETLITDNRLNY